jgi:hypothetical protein
MKATRGGSDKVEIDKVMEVLTFLCGSETCIFSAVKTSRHEQKC